MVAHFLGLLASTTFPARCGPARANGHRGGHDRRRPDRVELLAHHRLPPGTAPQRSHRCPSSRSVADVLVVAVSSSLASGRRRSAANHDGIVDDSMIAFTSSCSVAERRNCSGPPKVVHERCPLLLGTEMAVPVAHRAARVLLCPLARHLGHVVLERSAYSVTASSTRGLALSRSSAMTRSIRSSMTVAMLYTPPSRS